MIQTEVCVAGGGPAGLVLALLLARLGLEVVVLEKHEDFLRDFRGDTVHPSTLDLMDELGLGDRIRELPHRQVAGLHVTFADGTYQLVDFTRLRVAHPYLMFLPQWDFLETLAREASSHPTFTLLRSHEVVDVLREEGIVRGARSAGTGRGPRAAHRGRGRSPSTVREKLELGSREFGAPMDVLWFECLAGPTTARGSTCTSARGACCSRSTAASTGRSPT